MLIMQVPISTQDSKGLIPACLQFDMPPTMITFFTKHSKEARSYILHASFHHLKLWEDWGAFSFELRIAACYQPSWYLNNLQHIYLLTIYFLENQHHVVLSGSNLAIRNIVIAFFFLFFSRALSEELVRAQITCRITHTFQTLEYSFLSPCTELMTLVFTPT